jgi:hypothetical protein
MSGSVEGVAGDHDSYSDYRLADHITLADHALLFPALQRFG